MHGISRISAVAAAMSAGVALTVAGGMTASADDTFLIAQAPPPPTTRTPAGMDTGTGVVPPQTFGAPVQTFGAPQQEFTQPGVQGSVAQVPAGYVPPPPQRLGFGPGAGGGGVTAETTIGPMGAPPAGFAPQPMGMQPFDAQSMAPQPMMPQAMQPMAPQPMSPAMPQTASAPVEDFPMVAKSWGGSVRAQPSVDSAKVGSLREGEQITLMGRVEGPLFNNYAWFRIAYANNKTGYQWGGIICGIGTPINGAFEVCK